jgi:hypothetical protein
VVDTTGAKTSLDDLEAAAWAEDNVVEWYADVIEADVAMPMWGIIVTEDAKHTVDGDAWSVVRDKHDGLLLINV